MATSFFASSNVGSGGEFDRRKAAHLLRRAGFGASPAQIEQAVEQGLEAAVESLFADDAEQEDEFRRVYESVAGSLLNVGELGPAQAWWAHRLLKTRAPLVEKLTLFWHGHFASSNFKVDNGHLMRLQIDTLRRLARGNFRDLTSAVARDPAMLVYLDGESYTKDHPNENFARELMELFTCGIGNYTEADVLEAARAFSGWHRDGDQFVFRPEQHDADRKQFLGKAGRFDGQDIIDILMQHPATPRFIAAKLLRFFAVGEPSPDAVTAAAGLLDATQLDIKWFLRELFLSDYFYSDACYRRRIASPAEYVIGTLRTLGARVQAAELAEWMSGMGQVLLAPPNVKGWDGEQKWINSSTWPVRLGFAQFVSELNSEIPYGPNLPLADIVPPDMSDPDQVVDRLADVLMQGDLPAEVRSELGQFLVTTDDGANAELFRNEQEFRADKTRGALAIILGLPEYHAW
jgi:uncharacterized protein (DUF1800 family)